MQRWYDSATGRFLSEDPVFGSLENPTSLHPWAYANGNPLRYVDPSGRAGREVQKCLDQQKATGFPFEACIRLEMSGGCGGAVSPKQFVEKEYPESWADRTGRAMTLFVPPAAVGVALGEKYTEARDVGYSVPGAAVSSPFIVGTELTGVRGTAEVIFERDLVSGRALDLDESANRGLVGGATGMLFTLSVGVPAMMSEAQGLQSSMPAVRKSYVPPQVQSASFSTAEGTAGARQFLPEAKAITAAQAAKYQGVEAVAAAGRPGGVAAGGGDHIVLGLRNYGLENTATQVGGRTLLSDPNWKRSLVNAIADPKTKLSVSVDGLAGSSTAEKVMKAVQQGIKPGATPTNWEMSQLYQAGRLKDVTFLERGAPIANPFQ